jgi:hypothetical protein
MPKSRLWCAACLALVVLVGCGSSGNGPSLFDAGAGDGTSSGHLDATHDGAHLKDTGGSKSLCGSGACSSEANAPVIESLVVQPASATIVVSAGTTPTQSFKAVATLKGGETETVTASWSASDAPVGGIDSNGLYTPKGVQGGVVTVTATSGGQTATATLTVQVKVVDDQVLGGTPPATQMALQSFAGSVGDAGAPPAADAGAVDGGAWDPTITWAYPYNHTVFPRGLNSPVMMWMGGEATDIYYIHLTSPTYDLESFATTTIPAQYNFTAALWTALTNSTVGSVSLTVARYADMKATLVAEQTWTIGSGSMSGTIYYWAISAAAVVRIKPGASAPDMFLADASVPKPDGGTQPMVCPSCHSISANGSTLAMSTGNWGATTADVWSTLYDLNDGGIPFSSYERYNDPPSQFALAAMTPDGTMLVENWAPVRGNGGGQTDLPVDLTGAVPTDDTLPSVTGTNLETLVAAGDHVYFPAFSPDNQLFVYVDSTSNDLIALDWGATSKQFSNPVTLATASNVAGTKIAYPTLSPDHSLVIYQRGPDFGSLMPNYTGDLYAVETANPGVEIPLNTLNGVGYPFAAGSARDQDRDYEPTFAPVAAGGYFWVVFHSRRTYGNLLTGPAFTAEGSGTKQLWVAAINLTPNGSDPSHEPFWLSGQSLTTLNMRGYWSLPPCAQNGAACTSGSDCCGGYCDETNDAGVAVCGKPSTQTCSNAGDHCTTTSDCCNAAVTGLTCINGACAAPAPP